MIKALDGSDAGSQAGSLRIHNVTRSLNIKIVPLKIKADLVIWSVSILEAKQERVGGRHLSYAEDVCVSICVCVFVHVGMY